MANPLTAGKQEPPPLSVKKRARRPPAGAKSSPVQTVARPRRGSADARDTDTRHQGSMRPTALTARAQHAAVTSGKDRKYAGSLMQKSVISMVRSPPLAAHHRSPLHNTVKKEVII